MNLKLVRPSTDAPESLALYETLRTMSDESDEDVLNSVVEGLFRIVAKLESEHASGD
jgi:hypothetical protein